MAKKKVRKQTEVERLISWMEGREHLCSVGQERLVWWKSKGKKFKTIRKALETWEPYQIYDYLEYIAAKLLKVKKLTKKDKEQIFLSELNEKYGPGVGDSDFSSQLDMADDNLSEMLSVLEKVEEKDLKALGFQMKEINGLVKFREKLLKAFDRVSKWDGLEVGERSSQALAIDEIGTSEELKKRLKEIDVRPWQHTEE
jgi:hypothetical protein